MPNRKIFYSFHYDNDVFRVQQVRNIGALEDNPPVSANRWEEVRRGGDAAVHRWIDVNMQGRSCVVVLIGTETANRKFVKYEIEKGWNDGRGVIGVYIHNLNCPRTGTCWKGSNPFSQFSVNGVAMDRIVPVYDPPSYNAYTDVKTNLESWVENGIAVRKRYP